MRSRRARRAAAEHAKSSTRETAGQIRNGRRRRRFAAPSRRRGSRRARRPRTPTAVECTCVGLAALGVVHQRVGALNQFRRELARDAAPLGHRPELQADDADVDPDRARGQPPVLAASSRAPRPRP